MSDQNSVPAPEEDDFAAMLAEFEQTAPAQKNRLKIGDMVKGPVVSIGKEAVFVEVGAKSEAMLEIGQLCDRDGDVTVQVGDTIEARVVELAGANGCIVLRRGMGRGPDLLAELEQAYEHRMPIEGVVAETNKGGFEIQIGSVRAFCPISQIDSRFVEDPEPYVGMRYQFRIAKLQRGRGGRADVVVSRKALLQEEAAIRGAETRATLSEGSVLKGTVTSLKPYGAFVDIGGLEGMIHISELGHSRVEHPQDVLREGQSVEVQVLRIEQTGDEKRPEKIALSLKSLEQDPWQDMGVRFAEGSRFTGTVVRTMPFGAFVELAPGIEGLVHISELGAGRRINHPREVVKEGQSVEVTVLSTDLERKRISLSMDDSKVEEREIAAEAAPHIGANRNASLGTFGDLLGKFGKK